MEVRYEDLIANTSSVLQKICEFIRLPYDPQMEKYYQWSAARLDEVKTMYRDDGSIVITKEERLFNQRFTMRPPEASRVFRWRTEMDSETRLRFESSGRRPAGGAWLSHGRRPWRQACLTQLIIQRLHW